jgi:hypothetical protein
MLFTAGARPVTLIVAGSALTVIPVSRLIYQGKPDPLMKEMEGKGSEPDHPACWPTATYAKQG